MPCKCALDGTQKGYCEKIFGTPEMQVNVKAIKYALERSECHTLDRNNMRAQLDCNSSNIKKLQEAIEAIFRVAHWPYV